MLPIFALLFMAGLTVNNINAAAPVDSFDDLKAAIVETLDNPVAVYEFNEG